MAEVIWSDPAEHIDLETWLQPSSWFKIYSKKLNASMAFPSRGVCHLSSSTLISAKLWPTLNPCRVFYKQMGDKVCILSVMRAERDLRRFLLSKQ